MNAEFELVLKIGRRMVQNPVISYQLWFRSHSERLTSQEHVDFPDSDLLPEFETLVRKDSPNNRYWCPFQSHITPLKSDDSKIVYSPSPGSVHRVPKFGDFCKDLPSTIKFVPSPL